jgi:hypothetical protein
MSDFTLTHRKPKSAMQMRQSMPMDIRPGTGPWAPTRRNCAMDALMTMIALWLSLNFGLPPATAHPHIEIVPANDILFKRYRAFTQDAQREVLASVNAAASIDKRREVVAIYDDATRTIFLPDGWTGGSAAELSVLVHEMVHHLQTANGLRYPCPAAREEPAYAAQEKWLGLFGKNLQTEFDIDAMTLKVSTNCGF